MIYLLLPASEIAGKVSEEDKAATLSWADELAAGYYTHKAHYEMERCTVPVKADDRRWNNMPEGMEDPEWCFALARLSYLPALAKAYAYTGDVKYISALKRIFFSFTEHSDRNGLSWRSLETGIRVENIIRTLEILTSLSVDTKDIEERLDGLFAEHKEILINAHRGFHRLSNWGVMQDHGLLLIAIRKRDEALAKTALERLAEQAVLQTLPDGTHWEQSPMYQCEVLHCFLDTLLVTRRMGIEVPKVLEEKTHLMALSLKALTSVTGHLFMTGDSDEIDARDLLSLASFLFCDERLNAGVREENLWDCITPFGEINKERENSLLLRDGNAVLRTKEMEVHLFCGNMGSGHGHIAPLHIDVAGEKKPFFIDPGRFTYLDNAKRFAYKEAPMHNVPLYDGDYEAKAAGSWSYNFIPEMERPRYSKVGLYEAVEAIALGERTTRRRIVKLTDGIFVVADEFHSGKGSKATVFYHAHPACTLEKANGNSIMVTNGDEILHLASDADCFVEEGTVSLKYNEETPAKVVKLTKPLDAGCTIFSVLSRIPVEIKRVPVSLIDAGRTLKDEEAAAIEIKAGEESWTVISRARETVAQVDILKAGKAEGYGRLLAGKNDGSLLSALFC